MQRLLLVLLASAFAGTAWAAAGSKETCASISVPAQLVAGGARRTFTIWTTNGTGAYWAKGATLVTPRGAHTIPLGIGSVGPSYTETVNTFTGAISATAVSGTAWVCITESF